MQTDVAESPLDHLAILASRAGSEQIAEAARSLAERVAEGRFYLACFGQFKRGKSTLLDALLEDPVLPVGILPVTAIPTVVRYGSERSARVLLRGAQWRRIEIDALPSYVSEEGNPENAKDAVAVEVFMPSDLLATGLCLVDTPGIGSVFASSTATYDFIPHIDAALVVLGADPPITGEELDLAEKISRQVEHILFVLNKADRASKEEVATASEFARTVLERRLKRPVEIFEISAKNQLDGTRDNHRWPQFTAALSQLMSVSGRRLVWLAQKRGTARLAAWLQATIAEQRNALVEPLERTEARMLRLGECIEQSGEAIRDLRLLFAAEQQRLIDRLEERRQRFIAEILSLARARLAANTKDASRRGPALRRLAMESAVSIARELLLPWLDEETGIIEKEYDRITKRFTMLANDLLRSLAQAGVPQLAHLGASIEGYRELGVSSHFQFHRFLRITQPASPLRHIADFGMAVVGVTEPILSDAERLLERIIETNTSRIASDLEERLARAREELEVAIRTVLVRASNIAERALLVARESKSQGEATVRRHLAELSMLNGEVAHILEEMSELADPSDGGLSLSAASTL